ncbi:NPCBM/NEW2 domain-containing protein [Rugosimonospora acidiphila]|uniref:Alpha-galactosidase n=1 Tax=Rugosimonospora acidiphila TaxID=556531 RepID=A0ABP9RPN3_9ACTN
MRIRTAALSAVILAAVALVLPQTAGAVSPAAGPPNISTPPMGWNSRSLGCNVSDISVRQAVNAMATLASAGYTYVIIDDCWEAKQRDGSGNLTADPTRFPAGMRPLIAYVHSKGLKFGLNLSAGTQTCTGAAPGSYSHEATDGALVKSWGVDYVKYDWCSIPTANFPGQTSEQIAQALYPSMRQALGDDIAFAMNNEDGNSVPWLWGSQLATTWRTNVVTKPIADNYTSMLTIWETNMLRGQYATPHSFTDPDLLEAGLGGMTATEYQTQFSLWAMDNAPLILQASPAKAPANIVANPQVIAVDQDKLGLHAEFVSTDGWYHVLSKPLANGDLAVVLYNESDRETTISTTATKLKLPVAKQYRVQDLWTGAVSTTTGGLSAAVPAHGVAMYRISAQGKGAAKAAPYLTYEVDPATVLGDNKPSTVQPGVHNHIVTRVTNTGGTEDATNVTLSLAAPAGWTVAPLTKPSTKKLAAGKTFTVTWNVTPPVGTAQQNWNLTGAVNYGWGNGKKAQAAEVGGGAVVYLATAPDAGTSYLSDVPWSSAVNHLGPVEKDMSGGNAAAGDGLPITIGGVTYAKGLGTEAPAEVDYYAAGRCTSVQFYAGIDDEVDVPGVVHGSSDFQVWADGELVADTGVLTGGDAPKQVTADVTGAKYVRLIATNGGDNAFFDHADFADAKITCG